MEKKIAIIGAGGHGKVVGEIAALSEFEKIDFFDDKFNQIKKYPFSIVGNLDDLNNCLKNYDAFFVAIGDNNKRYEKIEWLKKRNLNIINLIHPKSTISKLSNFGTGTCIMANAVINPGSLIKNGVIINTSASIDHDCFVDDFSHISPNCSISGNVILGKFSHLGTGTSVNPGIRIGNSVRTAIGSRVFSNILDNTIYKF